MTVTLELIDCLPVRLFGFVPRTKEVAQLRTRPKDHLEARPQDLAAKRVANSWNEGECDCIFKCGGWTPRFEDTHFSQTLAAALMLQWHPLDLGLVLQSSFPSSFVSCWSADRR
jgi:hypothetical protein